MNANVETINIKNEPLIIWIDKNINNIENRNYLAELGYHFNNNLQTNHYYMNSFSQDAINTEYNNITNNFIRPFERIDEAIQDIKKVRFDSTIIIVSGRCFKDFVKEFHKNINDIYIIPKIIIFTLNQKTLKFPKEVIKEQLDKFYKCGGIQTDFNKIKEFIEKKKKEISNYPNQIQSTPKTSFNEELIFEPVTQIEDLILPGLFNKTVLQKPDHESNNRFNEYLCKKILK